MTLPTIGKAIIPAAGEDTWPTLPIDVDRLIASRMLMQANSGGGKSWALRRLLEQTFGTVQHLVIDPEGEFASLRERYDYILAGKGGDTPAEPRSAKLLARKLLELRTSAIMDIYELHAHERVRFVRYFLEALVDAPKDLWHPVLVIVDEAHVYAPQKGEAESLGAVIDLATRGRKRGFCAVLATQRIAKLHKDAAAELNNKLIGRSSLDVDMRRAAEELGFTGQEERLQLRFLRPGEFFAFGPALSPQVVKVKVGPVETTHPEAGSRHQVEAPPPTEKVLRVLSELADLPAEAEQEARDIAEARRQIATLRSELTRLKSAAPGEIPEAEVERRVKAALHAAERELGAAHRRAEDAERRLAIADAERTDALAAAENAVEAAKDTLVRLKRPARSSARPRQEQATPPAAPVSIPASREAPVPWRDDGASAEGLDGLKAGAVRMLREIARRHPACWTRSQLGALTGFTPSGGTFSTYLGELRRRGLIEVRGREVRVTEAGLDAAGEVPAAPQTHDETMAMWRGSLKAGCYRMLEVAAAAGPEGVYRQELADAVEMTVTGGTFSTYLGILRRNGLVHVDGQRVTAADVLWPEAVYA